MNNEGNNEGQENIIDDPKVIHTYQRDVEEALKKNNVSTTQVYVAEQKRINQEIAEENKKRDYSSSFNYRSLFIALIFILTGGGAIYYFYLFEKKPVQTTPIAVTQPLDIVNYDSKQDLIFPQGNKTALIDLIQKSKQNDQTAGVLELSFDTASDQFLYLFDPSISGIFLRALSSKFSFGLIKDQNEVTKSFLVVKVDSYQNAKGALLSEERNLAYSMLPIFNNSTSTLQFKDVVVDGHDTRSFVDPDGNTHLLYSFIDPQSLVFAEDNDTFKLIIDKIK